MEPVPVLVISGPPGVGKTTIGWEVFDQLVAGGRYPALVDLDLLGACWPVPDDDPYNERLKAGNLAAMWPNFLTAGVRCLIAAGLIEGRPELQAYGRAIPGAVLSVCRLRAGEDELTARITARGRERGPGIGKLVERAHQVARALEGSDVADFVVDTDDGVVTDIARSVLSGAGWDTSNAQ
jgi:DNA polymerase III delta prime subunit